MCGIVGTLVNKNRNFTVTEPYLVRMRDTMLHRGPDGGGLPLDGQDMLQTERKS